MIGPANEGFQAAVSSIFATQNQQNHNPYNLGDDALGDYDFQEADEDFEETRNNYFELKPLFDTSDIVTPGVRSS